MDFRISLFTTAALFATAATAATPSQVTTLSGTPGVNLIPKSLTGNNITMPFIMQKNDTETEFSIYDEDFRSCDKFSVISGEEKTITVHRELLPRILEIDIYDSYRNVYPGTDGMTFTLDEAKERLSADGYSDDQYEIRPYGNGYFFVDATGSPNYFYQHSIFGTKYPYRFAWLDESGRLFAVYNGTYRFTDRYETERIPMDNYTSKIKLSLLDIPHYLTDNGNETSVPLTREFFNTDDSYEYITPVYTPYIVEEEEGASDFGKFINSKETYMPTSLSIKSDDGKTTANINFAEYYYPGSIKLFTVNDKKYMSVDYREGEGDMTAIYRIHTATGSLNAVGSPVRISTNPSVIDRSMPVTVILNGNSANPLTLTVTGTDGICRHRCQILPGTSSVEIATGAFPSGIYVVTVSDGTTSTEHSKIIVR